MMQSGTPVACFADKEAGVPDQQCGIACRIAFGKRGGEVGGS